MTRLQRRKFLSATAAALAFANAPARALGIESFQRGQLAGFVLGGVERDPALLDAMASLGARLARVFFPFRRCSACTQFGRASPDGAAIGRLLDRAAKLSLGLVVVGAFDGIDAASFWSNESLRQSVVESWAWFARSFGGHPALAGLDLMNEPNPPWPSGDISQAQSTWNPLARQAISAIRNEQPSLPIVFEPVAGGNVLGLRGMPAFDDKNIVYSIHFYTPHDITHQGVGPTWTRRIPYPAGAEWALGRWDPLGVTRIDAARLAYELREARAFQLRHGVPIYVGEFSCVRWAPGQSAHAWLTDCLDLWARYGWSWTYHEFRGWPGWDAEINSEDPASTLRSIDAPNMRRLRTALALAAAR